jgi:hypothetical protein
MAVRRTQKDLFGKPIKRRRPRFEWSLERAEKATLPLRAARVRWLKTVMPKNRALVMPLETFYVFEEAKSSFVYGCFVASTVLSAAFVEHWLGARLSQRGFTREADRGLAAMIGRCRKNDLLNPALLDRIDRLRLIRNPFTHLKSFDHPHGLGQRSVRGRSHPGKVLEADAKESLTTMYTVAAYAFSTI